MKITIICGSDGKVLGTARQYPAERGQPVAHLIAKPGQTAHEVELPRELEAIESVDALHKALEKHLKTVRPKG
jgi:hypothetical protein